MKLGKIVLKNFLSYDNAEIDFSKVKKALIIGTNNGDPSDSNGAGKTNLFEAIAWNGWGVSKAETVDLNVKHGKDECSVEHHFEHDGKQITIVRRRNKNTGSSTIDFIIDGIVSNGATASDTNKEIQKFLNLDYNTFINSVYIKQDDVNSIASAKSSDARDLLEKVLNLDEYESYYEKAKEALEVLESEKLKVIEYIQSHEDTAQQKQESEAEIDLLKQVIIDTEKLLIIAKSEVKSFNLQFTGASSNKKQLDFLIEAKKKAENDLINLNEESNLVRQQAIDYKKNMDQKKTSIEAQINKEQDFLAQRQSLRIKIDEITEELKKIRSLEDSIKDSSIITQGHDSELIKIRQERGVADFELRQIKNKIDELQNKLDNPTIQEGTVCDNCLTPIDSLDEYKKHLSKDIDDNNLKLKEIKDKIDGDLIPRYGRESEHRQAILDKITDLNNQIDVIKNDLPTIESVKNQIALIEKDLININGLKQQLQDDGSSKELDTWKNMVKNKKSDIDNKSQEILKLEDDISKISVDTDLIGELEGKLKASEDSVDKLSTKIIESKTNIKNNENSIESFDIILSEIDKKQDRIKSIDKDLSVYIELSNAFSSKGIRAYILENSIVELEKEANAILNRLSNGRLSVEFRTKKEVKKAKGEKQDKLTFEVLINDGQKTFPFSSYSGGEKFRISFVLRVALSKLLLRRAHSKLEFLIIDEAISPLDGSGTEKMMEVINDLQEEFKTILVITHRNDAKVYFDEVISVNKTNTGSSVELITN
jgi:exonuclease SbcC